jgi:hypothetical protein
MAITASGIYALTQEKMWTDTAGQSLEAETHKEMLVEDGYTPNFTTHDFRDDVTNEISGVGYSSGGSTITTTEIIIGSPAAGQMMWDHADTAWAGSTLTNVMAAIDYFNVGSAATDMLIVLLDFISAVSTSSGTLTVQISSSGAYYSDFTP